MSSEPIKPTWKQPSHPDLIEIVTQPSSKTEFNTYARSLVTLPPGALIAKMDAATPTNVKRYSSVQVGRDSHIELNSDLLYFNHSCAPTVIFDTKNMEVRVSEDRGLKAGDPLTFFYPSSEWDMAQPFDCHCGTSECRGTIDGAKNMGVKKLEGYWLNEHIKDLLAAQSNGINGANGHTNSTNGTNGTKGTNGTNGTNGVNGH
jgi:hypothetical protein